MINVGDVTSKLALDSQALESLKAQAKKDPQQALKTAAQQFEAVFVQMMLKAMRDATPQDGLFESDQTHMYTSMLDQQLAQNLSVKGLGLAEIMVRQLSQSAVHDAEAASRESDGAIDLPRLKATDIPLRKPTLDSTNPSTGKPGGGPKDVQGFIDDVWSHAVEASKTTGIPAKFMVGHAALETGWGKRELRGVDGTESNNLFGIKAGKDWKGAVVEALTTEYINGKPYKSIEKFRAYDSYADSFRDYANLLRNNPRYANAVDGAHDAGSFAKGLQRGGYATDPHYAEKLTRVLNGAMAKLSVTA